MFYETDISPDHLEGFSHWLARKGGHPVPRQEEHPFTAVLDRAVKEPHGFEDILSLAGVRSTSDFADLYALASKTLITRAYQTIAGSIDPIVKDLPAKDFKPTELVSLEVTNEPATADEFLAPQDIQRSTIQFADSAVTAQVQVYGFHVPIDRRFLINKDFNAPAEMLAAAAGKLGQLPVRKLADILNANAAINGTALIDSDNAVASALDIDSLDDGIALLETTQHVPARYLLVPPKLKATAANLLRQTAALGIELVSNPWLSSEVYCYLLPAPDAMPVFARLAFSTPLTPGIRRQRLPEDATFFGQVYCVDLEFDLVPISRGIVRIGA